MKKGLFVATALVGGFATLAVGGSAFAQTAPASGAVAEVPPAADAPPQQATVQDVVVTGSLISRRDYVADSPITTVGQQKLGALGPTTLDVVLDEMPQIAALNPVATYGGQSLGGRANIDLRGLGIQRTLVLLDGRRLEPSDSLGTIDVNTVPTGLLSSVEVITGGASATYGSDAIAGVVNLKLNHNFQGVQLDAQYGETELGDAASEEFSLIAGSKFADDRGSFVMSMDYLDRDYAPRGNRQYFYYSQLATALFEGVIAPVSTNLPTQASINSIFEGKYGLSSAPSQAQGLVVNQDQTLFTSSTPVLNFKNDPTNVFYDGSVSTPYGRIISVQQPIDRYSAFFNATYDLTPDIQAYGQLLETNYTSNSPSSGYAIRTTTMAITNPYIPADLLAIMETRPNPTAPLMYNFASGRMTQEIVSDHYNVVQPVLGIGGSLLTDWTWDVNASYGRTDDVNSDNNQINTVAIENLLNAPDGGNSICKGGFDPFSTVTLAVSSPACFAYVNRHTTNISTFEQENVNATIQGSFFQLPAGELKFAAGADYRRNSYDYQPDSQITSGSLVQYTSINTVHAINASEQVGEVFGELLVPVVKDVFLIKSLDLDLAYRYSDYDTIGGASTYKATGDWSVNDWLSFRGGYQHALRAPSLGELNPQGGAGGGGVIGSTAQGTGDPCDVTGLLRSASNPNAAKVTQLCIDAGVPANLINLFRFNGSSVTTFTPPNGSLKAETADTFTGGMVLRSTFSNPWLSHASISADFYSINVTNAIGFITASVALSECFNENGSSNPTYAASNSYCQLITRDSSGNIIQINTPELNLAAYKTSGVDVQGDWALNFSDVGLPENAGRISVNIVLTYLLDFSIQNISGGQFVNYAGTIGNGQIDPYTISDPTWRGTTSFTYSVGPADLTLATRWFSSMYDSLNAGSATHNLPTSAGRIYFDLTGRFHLPQNIELRAGVLNVADTYPAVWTGQGVTDPSLYDIEGRRFFIGASKKF